MIRSFGDKRTQEVANGENTKRTRSLPADLIRPALRKLMLIEAAHDLKDLASPPGNRLEGLAGNLDGFHSIRINDQWRIVFRWSAGAEDVQIVDYH